MKIIRQKLQIFTTVLRLMLKLKVSTLRSLVLLCLLGLTAVSVANAGELKATIVEENGGAIGEINWVVLSEKDFSPVLEGKGGSIHAKLDPGLYIVSVDGDTQGRTSIKIDKGIKLVKICTRKFY